MADSLINYLVDPRNSDALDHLHVQSVQYSGTYFDLIAPAAANYPASSPTRIFLYTQWIIDVSDLVINYPCILYDVTTSTLLSRSAGAPGANEYYLPPSTSVGRNIIELHSGQAGHTIGYDMYVNGSTLTNIISFSVAIGDWNMDSTSSIAFAHGLGEFWDKIRFVQCIIKADGGAAASDLPLNSFYSQAIQGGVSIWDSTTVTLERLTGGIFDSTDFNATSYNRGYVNFYA